MYKVRESLLYRTKWYNNSIDMYGSTVAGEGGAKGTEVFPPKINLAGGAAAISTNRRSARIFLKINIGRGSRLRKIRIARRPISHDWWKGASSQCSF